MPDMEKSKVAEMFNSIASGYDFLNRTLRSVRTGFGVENCGKCLTLLTLLLFLMLRQAPATLLLNAPKIKEKKCEKLQA